MGGFAADMNNTKKSKKILESMFFLKTLLVQMKFGHTILLLIAAPPRIDSPDRLFSICLHVIQAVQMDAASLIGARRTIKANCL